MVLRFVFIFGSSVVEREETNNWNRLVYTGYRRVHSPAMASTDMPTEVENNIGDAWEVQVLKPSPMAHNKERPDRDTPFQRARFSTVDIHDKTDSLIDVCSRSSGFQVCWNFLSNACEQPVAPESVSGIESFVLPFVAVRTPLLATSVLDILVENVADASCNEEEIHHSHPGIYWNSREYCCGATEMRVELSEKWT